LRSLAEFLKTFYVLYPLLRTAESVERIAYELAEDCAAENIHHVEVRFAPLLQSHKTFQPEQVVEAVLKGLRRAERDFGVTSGVIVCLFRSHSPSVNRKAFESMKTFYGKGVVGLDVAGDEARYPTREFSDFFLEANKLGIPTTCHAGETSGTENLRTALELKVHRIGHGTHLLDDDRLVAEVVRRGIPLEIGLTSNVRTKAVKNLRSHPIREFMRRGVPVTLNTDDRGILDITLTGEYGVAASLGMGFEDLAGLSMAGANATFLSPVKKRALRTRFEKEIRALARTV
jgi:adenosine deaminase